VLARNTLEYLLNAARLSGDDCLAPGTLMFAGEGFPYDLETGELKAPLYAHYMPLGPDAVAGLLEPSVFGSATVLIRREVLEKIGGYTEIWGAGHEDWELHARLALGGFRTDIVPEYLHYYRQLEDGMARTADEYPAKRRLMDAYGRHLAPVGMKGAADAMFGLYREYENLQRRIRQLEGQLKLHATRFELFRSGPEPVGLELYPTDDEGPWLVRSLRGVYRRAVPLDTRLRVGQRLHKLLGRA
jgi:GT2 family glycosyltransferase